MSAAAGELTYSDEYGFPPFANTTVEAAESYLRLTGNGTPISGDWRLALEAQTRKAMTP